MRTNVAIVGAGISGLTAAWALRQSGIHSTIFEKSRGLSGRAASRTRHGVRFDHGANYFKTDSESVSNLVLESLPTDDLVRIEKDVWTFDQTGSISPGDAHINAKPKWTYRSGISTLGKLLKAAADVEVRQETRICRLIHARGSWQLESENKEDLGIFDAVLLTAPAPQANTILSDSALPPKLGSSLRSALGQATYHRQFSVILGSTTEIERPGNFFALVNSDQKHDVAWLSFENDKPGHVPSGESAIVIQMSPAWSAAHYTAPIEQVVDVATHRATDLLQQQLSIAWSDVQRWKFAHPTVAADKRSLFKGSAHRLFFAGDALVGKGRIPRSLETGLEAAEKIATSLLHKQKNS